jgi:hypothetical protein
LRRCTTPHQGQKRNLASISDPHPEQFPAQPDM